jgi:hypothetical protein
VTLFSGVGRWPLDELSKTLTIFMATNEHSAQTRRAGVQPFWKDRNGPENSALSDGLRDAYSDLNRLAYAFNGAV